MNPNSKKVFVSGCYDLLHSGHIAFFQEASKLGELYVGLGSDRNIYQLKGRETINPEEERLYMVKAIKYVKDAWVNQGYGILDFSDEIKSLNPDIFFVNEDGHSPEKEKLCKRLGIKYVVSFRKPHANLPKRSTTAIRKECTIPYRIDLAGGWIDQPYVSKFTSGPVITISIEPDYDFNDRSGMSTSTRKKAMELWQYQIPDGNKEKLAKTLFCFENEPGKKYVSGSQDALGIVLPGINYLFYDQEQYWPSNIETIKENNTIEWLEQHLFLLALTPRGEALDVLDQTNINAKAAKNLASASDRMWEAIKSKDFDGTKNAMVSSFEAQVNMFPNMINHEVQEQIEKLKNKSIGYKLSGAGGGGYLVLFSEKEIPNTLKVRIRH